ncbi:copper homeostasis protein CutC [Microbacterium ureisolvens]|uniref:PF03932 family protein CutC n=1 Tax=Microbacterium ureisolvens TaxID=2781186 RepID=A0ABS7HSG9_9MICO|nr:copper homeostasis protein CutC [Microbacterium ureisolvens]MBW9108292.1 copper homeostasis protein CutC [Microbacterium ureisolvens]
MPAARPIEIAVQDPAGARSAIAAGAARLELCQALDVGGLTPSLATLEAVLAAVDPVVVNVLVRPRGGGFVYDPEEVALVSADIRACVERGAGGVVVGALTAAGGLDVEALRRWRDAAGPATLVFHRAVDAAADPSAVFDALVAEGVDRVLTSGGAPRSIDGLAMLAAFAQRSGGVEVMAGGGVQPADIPALFAAGVDAVHLSARVRAGHDAPSGPGGGSAGHDVTDPALVAEAVAAAG